MWKRCCNCWIYYRNHCECSACLCLSEGVAHRRRGTETQQVHPPQSCMEESSYTHSCGADGEWDNLLQQTAELFSKLHPVVSSDPNRLCIMLVWGSFVLGNTHWCTWMKQEETSRYWVYTAVFSDWKNNRCHKILKLPTCRLRTACVLLMDTIVPQNHAWKTWGSFSQLGKKHDCLYDKL